MLITLPIAELVPGMFVDSVSKQQEHVNSIKIKTRGLVRDKTIIQRLISEGVEELLIDFTQSDVALPKKYQPKPEPAKPKVEQKPAANEEPQGITVQQEFLKASVHYEQHSRKLQSLYSDITAGLKMNMAVLDDIAVDIVGSVFRNHNALTILTRLKDKHIYNWRHMINTAILVSVFAKYLGYKEKTIKELAMGALLHDIGQAKMPQGVLSKPSALNDNEMQVVKKHVAQSLGLVKGEKGITPLMLDMIVNHHERLDGTGYPRGITAEKLSRPARMMAIADVYDAMTADRPHQMGEEPISALRYLLANKQMFDSELVQRFIKCLGVHPVGTIVKLNNDRLALVMEGNHENPIKPKVKVFYNAKHKHHVTAKDVDLNVEKELKIIASIKPLDYQLNLARLLKEHLLV
ncbi:HD-GYP domain-containing protein [Pseudoalteromonas sp. ACER1]|jgi:HD-GYP domain-containing protein (c-di-GMP phosphodiesterase class II)|uniref:HD-GYP domain-containing protein n=1 Tax=unclassified Pseudoalteromonas TaxID=194690 RepID=UPI00110B5CE8|nr:MULTISPECIES: HD-GYP domain-containing protein [unclassified Pseudoalteromonas]MEC8224909.1 HD-GYP domain-containing protein [Pseudomonadota bacterium]MCF2847535.1 HD-GYP domain-containing protein [Pseudoalteromonas sp. PAST1]MCH2085808.1 HD-GYP domain-containing protein [Pseudoalteromonas sp.]MCO7211113.1 HD-GYP domain-containing protein [Pseudoalteromonas sp. ACER1]MED5513537.1 HD-GYP domain-containing protein [Pseudomonadota bacterium]